MSDEPRRAFDGLPPLGDVIRAHGLAAKKNLGQNFLLDLNLTGRIARAAGDLSACDVVEIGPGPGGLTRALLAAGARRVVAIERDERVRPILEEISAHYPGRLTVVFGDAMAEDWRVHVDGPAKLVANLPYNIGTELLLRWLTPDDWPPRWLSLTLMFQKEVAQRIVAAPGDKHYGRLGALAGWRTQAHLLFEVNRNAFTPPPKVTSAVVQISPRETPLAEADERSLSAVTAAAFGQRRKMLRQSLKPLFGAQTEAALEAVGIDPTRRAETVPVEAFCALARRLRRAPSSSG